MWLLLCMVLHLGLVSGLPCCTEDYQMIHVHNTVYCSDFTNLISVYQWCENLAMLDPDHLSDGEVFIENSMKTEYTMNNQTWDNTYCTGSFSKNFSSMDESLENVTGKTVAMICLQEDDNQHYSLYATCLLISCVFLLATLVIYLWLPELRDLQGKCVLCFIFSLMVGYICLAYLQLPLSSPEISNNECIIIAFLTYFWMMSAFFWLNINSFNMWRSAVLAHIHMSEKKLMLAYYVAGWGMPFCFLVIALITHHMPGDQILRPNFGVESCWFAGKLELWSYFYGPVLVLLICNIVYFISTALYLWSDYRSPNPMPRIKSLRTKFCLYFKLFLIMGITWIFEILSSIDNEPWYVTDILNCFQGVIIFVVMIVLRKRVWRLLGTKELCGFHLGSCWEKMEDEETVNEVVDEQPLSTNDVIKPLA